MTFVSRNSMGFRWFVPWQPVYTHNFQRGHIPPLNSEIFPQLYSLTHSFCESREVQFCCSNNPHPAPPQPYLSGSSCLHAAGWLGTGPLLYLCYSPQGPELSKALSPGFCDCWGRETWAPQITHQLWKLLFGGDSCHFSSYCTGQDKSHNHT